MFTFDSCGRYATLIVTHILPWVKTPRLHSCHRYAMKTSNIDFHDGHRVITKDVHDLNGDLPAAFSAFVIDAF